MTIELSPKADKLLKSNAVTLEYFLNNDYWTLDELEAYKEFCEVALKHNLGLESTRAKRRKFLQHYERLKRLKL